MVLVGLMGIKGSGKSTAASYLVNNYGFVEKSFAECLKRACKELFLLEDEQVFGTQEQKETPDPRWYDCTPRKIMQYVGTDLLRENLDKIIPELGKNIFTRHIELWYTAEIAKNPNIQVVISDIRFQNEVDFVQKLGGVVIKIDRPLVLTDDTHSSEIELQLITSYDHLINNTDTLEDLSRELDNYMKFKTICCQHKNPIRFVNDSNNNCVMALALGVIIGMVFSMTIN